MKLFKKQELVPRKQEMQKNRSKRFKRIFSSRFRANRTK